MKTLHLIRKLFCADEAVFSSNGVTFHKCENFLKWPKGTENRKVASVFCDEQDRLYLLTRGGEHALMVFDSMETFCIMGKTTALRLRTAFSSQKTVPC
jgi:hypothetical protein